MKCVLKSQFVKMSALGFKSVNGKLGSVLVFSTRHCRDAQQWPIGLLILHTTLSV